MEGLKLRGKKSLMLPGKFQILINSIAQALHHYVYGFKYFLYYYSWRLICCARDFIHFLLLVCKPPGMSRNTHRELYIPVNSCSKPVKNINLYELRQLTYHMITLTPL